MYSDGSYVGGCGYAGGAPAISWDQSACRLTLVFSAPTAGEHACRPNVTAAFEATASPLSNVATLAATATATSNAQCNRTLTELLWLSDVIVPHTTIVDFFLPLLPGINLTRPYFAQDTPHFLGNTYPGRSYASDLVGWSVEGGARLAMMGSRNATDAVTPSNVCLTGQSADDWFWHHTYPCYLHAGQSFTTPPLVVALGTFDFKVIRTRAGKP